MKKVMVLLVSLVSISVCAQKPELIIPTRHAEAVTVVNFSLDGKYIFSANKNVVKIWETASGRLIKDLVLKWGDKVPGVLDMSNSPDGKTIAIATYRNIHFFSLDDFTVVKEIHVDEIEKVLYSKDGSELFVATGEDTEEKISKINISNSNITDIYTHKIAKDKNGISNICFNKDGKQLLVCMDKDGTAILNSATGQELKMVAPENKVISFTPDDNFLSVKHGKQTLDVLFEQLNAATLQLIWSAVINYEDKEGVSDNISLDFLSDDAEFKSQLAWNPINGNLIIASQHQLFTIDFANKKQSKLKIEAESFGQSVAAAQDGKRIVLGTMAPAINEYNLAAQKYTRRYGSAVFITETIQAANDSSYQLLLNSQEGSINDLRFEKTNFATKGLKTASSFSKSAISKDGKLGAYFHDHALHFFNTATMQEQPETIATKENFDMTELAFSENGQWLVGVSVSFVLIFDIANKTLIKKIATGYYALFFHNNYKIATISNDGKKLVTYTLKEAGSGKNSVMCIDINTGNTLWEKDMVACCFKFINSEKQVFMVVKDNPSLLIVDAMTGNTISEKKLPIEGIYAANTSNDLKKLAFTTVDRNFTTGSKDIQVWDIVKNESITIFKGHTGIATELEFMANGNFLVSAAKDFTTRFWDIRRKRELGKLITFEGSNDWVFVTPDGRFDASSAALQSMYYTKGKEIIPLDALYEQYYTPKLISRLLAGEQFDPVPDIGSIKIRPLVKLSYAAVQRNLEVSDDMPTYQNTTGVAEISVTANAPDDKIDEIRLFHNGKIVTLTTRNLIVTDDDKSNSAVKKYTINLQPGENTFRSVALNSQRTESKPDEIAVIYTSGNANNSEVKTVINNTDGAPIAPVDKSANMYLIVVGINKYQNKTMSLNYALADATSFKEEVEKDAKSIISSIKTYFVTDNDADKKGITNALKEVQQNARPQDVFIFYYAGHGVISGSSKEFYLVPTDVADLKNVDAALQQHGIAAKELQQFAIDIAAQKQLFILDACQSAGAFEAMLSSNGNQQKSIAVVARSTGTHWMAASGAQQFANEFASLGHGVFTYVLLEALKGAAKNNNMITVNNLKNYLQQTVPELMKKYNGSAQYPASYGFGNDFPVEIINK